MAGDWIPMRMDLLDDPAVIVIAASLDLEEYAVVGRLLKLWSWANRHLKDGHAFVPDKWIDDYLKTSGFASALLAAGWLQTRSDGGLEFTHFDRWNSQGAKIRLGETLRKKAFRARQDKSQPVPKVSRTKSDVSPGPEKRREEKRRRVKPSPGPAEERKPRPRDDLFDAIATVTGSDPNASGSHVAGVKKRLLLAEPPYTAAEVFEFGARIAELCPWTEGRRPTLGEVEKYIGLLRSGQGEPKPRAGFKTHDQRVQEEMGLI